MRIVKLYVTLNILGKCIQMMPEINACYCIENTCNNLQLLNSYLYCNKYYNNFTSMESLFSIPTFCIHDKSIKQ